MASFFRSCERQFPALDFGKVDRHRGILIVQLSNVSNEMSNDQQSGMPLIQEEGMGIDLGNRFVMGP